MLFFACMIYLLADLVDLKMFAGSLEREGSYFRLNAGMGFSLQMD